MTDTRSDAIVRPQPLGPSDKAVLPMGLGGSWFVPYSAPGAEDPNLLDAMQAMFDNGIRHFDTGAGYGGGHSEALYGRFVKGRRSEVYLASKADPAQSTAEAMLAEVEGSLRRLETDSIDLYYIHWPRTGRDMRPVMEGLERARAQGKVAAVGVSNFSVGEMRQVQEVGTIDVHQLGYNLLWRQAEAEILPFCVANGIDVVSYSTLAHGILTGKFPRHPELPDGDQRHRILPFRSDVWPHVHEGVEKLKAIAAELGRPLMHLAVRWNLARPGVGSVLVGARNREQAVANVAALSGSVPDDVIDRMTAISDEIIRHVPDADNLFGRKG
jgi:aryl-alcohol dehydrogenase-like predicted oxidoreductase